jgi:peptidoglycan/xylan/chitin deacetylase (PgdA/CDA1 family)
LIYFVKTPRWLQSLYGRLVWQIKTTEKVLYLSFDDGPHPTETNFVLETLKTYHAKATFFCIGKNVDHYPHIFQDILANGHAIGNHTQHHLNGWKTTDEDYLLDFSAAGQRIETCLFRPPYGRIRRSQIKKIMASNPATSIVMWSVLSGDFDPELSKENCLKNVMKHAGPGSIIVFHDSSKASAKLRYALPLVLDYFSKQGYRFEGISSTPK